MKRRYIIIFIDIMLLILLWIIANNIGDKFNDSGEQTVMGLVAYAAYIYVIIFYSLVFLILITIVGLILSKIRKNKESIFGFLISLLINIVLFIAILIKAYM